MPRAADYPGGEDAMLWGEYGFAPRFPRPAEPQPIGELIERASKGCRPRSNCAPPVTLGALLGW